MVVGHPGAELIESPSASEAVATLPKPASGPTPGFDEQAIRAMVKRIRAMVKRTPAPGARRT
jgi:hypothetical protein